ncbi:MAG: AMP-binding protein, partial [Pseudomonadota bacterium]
QKFFDSWSELFPEDSPWDQEIPVMPLYHVIDQAAKEFSDKTAIDFYGKKYSYAKLLKLINKSTKGLQKIGVGPEMRVGLMMPNCPQYMIMFFAILKCGASVVNLNPLYHVKELKNQIDQLDVKIICTLNINELYNKANNLVQTSVVEKIIIGKFERSLPFFKSKAFQVTKKNKIASVLYNNVNISMRKIISNDGKYKEVDINPIKDIALYQFTGGTTGVPKAAMLTHSNVYSNIYQASSMLNDNILKKGKESIIAVLPFFHIFALTSIMGVGVMKGAKLILHPKFEIRKLLQDVLQKKATILVGVPSIYTAIINYKDLNINDLHSLKFCISGGANLSRTLKDNFEHRINCPIYQGYGLTESSPIAALCPTFDDKLESPKNTIGIPLPGTIISIRDIEDNDKIMNPEEKGEIFIKGPQVMLGYYNKPTDKSHMPEQVIFDGFLKTGDVGFLDKNGFLFIVDRLKEVIICGGVNIYPSIIEEILNSNPAIKESAAIAIEDEYKGQVVKIFVVLKVGLEMTEEKLRDSLKDKLTKLEMPKYIEFVSEIPKTMIGKIDKKALIEVYDDDENDY